MIAVMTGSAAVDSRPSRCATFLAGAVASQADAMDGTAVGQCVVHRGRQDHRCGLATAGGARGLYRNVPALPRHPVLIDLSYAEWDTLIPHRGIGLRPRSAELALLKLDSANHRMHRTVPVCRHRRFGSRTYWSRPRVADRERATRRQWVSTATAGGCANPTARCAAACSPSSNIPLSHRPITFANSRCSRQSCGKETADFVPSFPPISPLLLDRSAVP
jgi:hypothetical protein